MTYSPFLPARVSALLGAWLGLTLAACGSGTSSSAICGNSDAGSTNDSGSTACNGSTNDSGPACTSTNDAGSTCVGTGPGADFIAKYCGFFMPCCKSAGYSGDPTMCRTSMALMTDESDFDLSAAPECLEQLQAASSLDGFCDGEVSKSYSACQQVLKSASTPGTKQLGEPCARDSECISSSEGDVECTQLSFNGDAGRFNTRTCMLLRAGKAGDTPCVATVASQSASVTVTHKFDYPGDAPPPKAYECHRSSDMECDAKTLQCTLLGQLGDSCFSSSECSAALFCDRESSKCISRLPVDSACSEDRACQDASGCDTTTKKCVALLPIGAGCSTPKQCASGHCKDTKCSASESIGWFFGCGR